MVFDPSGRLLLLRTSDLCEPPLEWWELPGGGIERGEEVEQAARRELREETGIAVENIGPSVARVRERFCFAGKWFDQVEPVFAGFLDSSPTITPALVDDVEAQAHLGHGWWRMHDAATSGLRLYPTQLPEIASPFARHFANLS